MNYFDLCRTTLRNISATPPYHKFLEKSKHFDFSGNMVITKHFIDSTISRNINIIDVYEAVLRLLEYQFIVLYELNTTKNEDRTIRVKCNNVVLVIAKSPVEKNLIFKTIYIPNETKFIDITPEKINAEKRKYYLPINQQAG